MKYLLILLLVLAAIAFVHFYFFGPEKPMAESQPSAPAAAPTALSATEFADTEFADSVAYGCADGKTLEAAFTDGVARVSLSGAQTFTLEQVSADDESGIKFANEEVVLWVHEDSAFVEENGTTTYAGCRAA